MCRIFNTNLKQFPYSRNMRRVFIYFLLAIISVGASSQSILDQTPLFLRSQLQSKHSDYALRVNEDGESMNSTSDNDEEEKPHRIVGGTQVSIYQVPWQVAVIQDNQFVCGGTILSTIWVLTAAHCVYGFGNSTFAVRAGSDMFRSGGQARRVSFIAIHGQYNSNTYNHDLAMLRTRRRFVFGPGVRPARLPTRYSRQPNAFLISGWGVTNANNANPVRRLRAAVVYRVYRSVCSRLYSGEFSITNNMICASAPGRDACQGDSGGPVVSNGIVYGVVSFGIGCAQSRYPGVNTSVRREAYWILAVARLYSRRSLSLDSVNGNATTIQHY